MWDSLSLVSSVEQSLTTMISFSTGDRATRRIISLIVTLSLYVGIRTVSSGLMRTIYLSQIALRVQAYGPATPPKAAAPVGIIGNNPSWIVAITATVIIMPTGMPTRRLTASAAG